MTIQSENKKPFSMAYVLRTTTRNMRKSLDLSIDKTFGRIAEFDGDTVKSREVFDTLGHLHSIRKQLEDFQNNNKQLFQE